MGYYRAGFDVVGIDIKRQPNYPFTFIQADAMEYPLRALDWGNGKWFDAVHASPPCQAYSKYVTTDGRWSHGIHNGFNAPRYIAEVREQLQGTPFVIENVMGAKSELRSPIMLCGAMVGLKIPRHRLFESNIAIRQPPHPKCKKMAHPLAEDWIAIDPVHRNRRIYSVVGKGRQTGSVQVWKELMGMPWAVHDYDLAQAIPPAYTEYIGKQLLELI